MSHEDDEVGYGRPPKNTRFKPGKSGNPKGRPKRPHSMENLIDKELSVKVPVKENGRSFTIRKREILVKRIMQKALEGDLKAAKFLMPFIEKSEIKNIMMQSQEDKDRQDAVYKTASNILQEIAAMKREAGLGSPEEQIKAMTPVFRRGPEEE